MVIEININLIASLIICDVQITVIKKVSKIPVNIIIIMIIEIPVNIIIFPQLQFQVWSEIPVCAKTCYVKC